jgi:hypothetical protein
MKSGLGYTTGIQWTPDMGRELNRNIEPKWNPDTHKYYKYVDVMYRRYDPKTGAPIDVRYRYEDADGKKIMDVLDIDNHTYWRKV